MDINGGNIDGTTIGGTTPAAGTFSSLTTTTADINGGTIDGATIGGASAAAGTFTDLTASGTVSFSGATVSNGGTVTTIDINGGTIDGVTIGGSSAGAITGTTITGTSFVSSGNMTFGDSDKAVFGAGSDLQIYHDGNNSFIDDQGTGSLVIQSNGAFTLIQNSSGVSNARFDSAGAASLRYNGAEKLATTATGIDVTGTVTADGLTVDGTTANPVTVNTSVNGAQLKFNDGTASTQPWSIGIKNDGSNDFLIYNLGLENIEVYTADKLRQKIANNGNVSFYEDTGTTPKFFWDASAERVGLRTNAPSDTLDVRSGGIRLYDNTDGNGGVISFGSSAGYQTIGGGSGSNNMNYRTYANHIFKTTTGPSSTTDGTERMRITSAGELLVGKTSADNGATVGFEYNASLDVLYLTRAGTSLSLNRTSTDGGIVNFNKDGTPVGSIGSYVTGPSIFIGSGNTGVLFADAGDSVHPWNPSTNAGNDNVLDLGAATQRWDDVYATNGTIQTSDRNEKQDIEELSEAEHRVAVAAKSLLRKFRWKSSVEEKGDDARIHFGIIAQDLQAAFEAEGLDAGRYAMFIHSTWTDEETGEERSRMGVRYSELLAFIIAAL